MARSTLAAGTQLRASSTGLSSRAEGGRFQFHSMLSIYGYDHEAFGDDDDTHNDDDDDA